MTGNLRYGIIEVTTQCQLRCPGCYMVRRDTLGWAQMSLERAVRVLDLCRDTLGHELETMDILGGEPLIWPYLQEYIEILLARGIKPWVFTNMLAITPELAWWLHEHDVYITGKLNVGDLTDPHQLEIQAEMIGGSGALAGKLATAIKSFQVAGYRSPQFTLENLIRIHNLPLVPDFLGFCRQEDIRPDIELLAYGEGLDEEYWQVAPTPQLIAAMIREIGLTAGEVLLPHIFNRCRFCDSGLYFACDGHIRACSNSTVRLAQIDDPEPVKKAYESTLICHRRRLTQQKVGEPCGSCSKWEECRGGCRATAEGLGGPFGGYPLCPVPFM